MSRYDLPRTFLPCVDVLYLVLHDLRYRADKMSDWTSSWKCYTVTHDNKIKCDICGLETYDEMAKAHSTLKKKIKNLREIENKNRIDEDSRSNCPGNIIQMRKKIFLYVRFVIK